MPADPIVRVRWPVAVLTLVGGVAVLVAFTLLEWMTIYRPEVRSETLVQRGVSLNTIRRDRTDSATTAVALDYVTWLGWALLAAMVIVGVRAAVPDIRGTRWAVGAVAIGLGGAVATWRATASFYRAAGPDELDTVYRAGAGFSSASIGAYVALGGFLLGAGAGGFSLIQGQRPRLDSVLPHLRSLLALRGRAAASALLVMLAAVLLGIGFAVASWYAADSRSGRFTFDSFGSYVESDPSVIVQAYFPALAYATAVAAVAAAGLAFVRSPLSFAARTIAILAAVSGVVCTVWALADLLDGPYAPVHGLFDDTASGPYLVVAGYLCALAAAVTTPSRRG